MMNPNWTILIFISMKSENIPSYFYIFLKKCVYLFSWVSSVTQLCSTLCNPMDCSTPGSLVHYQLPDLAQTHVHWVIDAIQSYLLSPPYPPAFNLSQHQDLFQWVSSLHQVAKVLEPQLQHQSFQWIFRTDSLQGWLVWSPCCPRDSQEFIKKLFIN